MIFLISVIFYTMVFSFCEFFHINFRFAKNVKTSRTSGSLWLTKPPSMAGICLCGRDWRGVSSREAGMKAEAGTPESPLQKGAPQED